MARILADLPDEDIRWLDARAEAQGKSRAAVLREAVASYKAGSSADWIDGGFGLWRDRTDMGDAAAWQRLERASTTKPWDDDYEAVKAEFPDLFDIEDDRQRALYLDMRAGRHPLVRGGR